MKHCKFISTILIITTAFVALNLYTNTCVEASTIQTGDVNRDGVINIADATLIQKYLSGIKTDKEFYSQYADFDRSGKINVADATLIQKYCIGTICVYGDYLISVNNGTAAIYKYFGSNNRITIPSKLYGNSYEITSISSNAFYNNKNLVIVNLPENIKTIENYAFYNCSELTTIYSYNKNLRWGNSFVNCPKFQSIKFK